MTLAAISIPRWISYSVSAGDETYEKHIGLHQSCSNLDEPHCRSYPYKELCRDGERYFCSMWRTIGFLASLTALLCLAGLVTFGVVMRGGKFKRETGWPFATLMMVLVAVFQLVTISIVVCPSAPALVLLVGCGLETDEFGRHTSTTTTTSSRYPAGTLMFRGFSAPSVPLSALSLPLVLPLRRTCCLPRRATTFWRTRWTPRLDDRPIC